MADSMGTEKGNMTLYELRRKYIGKRYCIFKGINRGVIGKCKWIEQRSMDDFGKLVTSIWYRIEVEIPDGYHLPQHKSYWAMEDQIIRIQDEPDEVPYYSGW